MNEIENSENILQTSSQQYAKKVVSNSLWLVDVTIGLVNSVLNFPEEQVTVFGEIKIILLQSPALRAGKNDDWANTC